jgi:hypothetical protein
VGPSVRGEHVESSGLGDEAAFGALLSDASARDPHLAEGYDGGRCRFDGPIGLDRGGAFGCPCG